MLAAPSRMSAATLKLSLGQHADAGRKPVQQDCHGARIPGAAAADQQGRRAGPGRRHRLQQRQPGRQPRGGARRAGDRYGTSEA